MITNLDIGIPTNLDNSKSIFNYLKENYECNDWGMGFGFYSVLLTFDNVEDAKLTIQELKEEFNINFDNESETEPYYSIYEN